jgi:hypothetical protein
VTADQPDQPQPESPAPQRRAVLKAVLRWGGIALAVLVFLFAVIQAVPYGRDHSNPPVRQEPAWDSPQTRALAADACFDCHSNQTHWPWYSNVAPVSWLVQRDVDSGRNALNFSEWDRPQRRADEAAEKVAEKEMPLSYYTWLHPNARLSSAERQALVQGLQAMFGGGGGGGD